MPFFGQWVFQLFGISVNGLRIVGGVLFFTMGYDMLQGKTARTKQPADTNRKDEHDSISVTPLGIPLIAGPGAITNAIVLMQDAHEVTQKVILIASMAFICLLMFISLRASEKITRILGETGNRVLVRLMGLIIMVIAVEFFFAGLKPIVQDILTLSSK